MTAALYPQVALASIKAPGRHSLVGGPFGSKLVSADYVDDGVPVIRGINLPSEARFSYDDLVHVTSEKVRRDLAGNLAFPGDVVVTQRGTLGQVGLIPPNSPWDRFVISQSQMKLTVDDTKADGTFVYYALRSPLGQHEILSRALTAGVPHINLGLLGQVQIPSPPLPIQRKIAAILSAYDDFIENNRRRIRILEEMAGRIYREWFVDLRYPGGEGVSFVDSLLGAVPVGWSVLPLSDLAEVTKGLSYSGSYLGDCGRAMANLKCLDPAGGYRREGTKPYSGPCQRKHEVAAGDVVVANTDLTQAGNVIGAPAIIPRRGFEQGGLITHHLFSVKPEEGVQRSFLFETLREERFRVFARGRASGTTVLGLRTGDCQAYPVLLPPKDLRERYGALADGLLQLAERLEDAAETLGECRDLLLPQLIAGEIDVDDLDIPTDEDVA